MKGEGEILKERGERTEEYMRHDSRSRDHLGGRDRTYQKDTGSVGADSGKDTNQNEV